LQRVLERKDKGKDAPDVRNDEELPLRHFSRVHTWIHKVHELARGAMKDL
jgi:hypothetical protein